MNAMDHEETPRPTVPSPTGVNLGDVMILVGAAGVGLSLLRVAIRLELFTNRSNSPFGRVFLQYESLGCGCFLVPLSVALLVSSFRDRAASRRDLVSRVGFVSCLAVLLASIGQLAYFAALMLRIDPSYREFIMPEVYANIFEQMKEKAGPMILGAWLALALSGRWRVGLDGADRMGFLVGAIFLLINLHSEVYFLVNPFFR